MPKFESDSFGLHEIPKDGLDSSATIIVDGAGVFPAMAGQQLSKAH